MAEMCTYRAMKPGEESVVCDLVARSFDQFVSPDYSPEGRQEFRKYARPDAPRQRSEAGHDTFVAVVEGEIVGMIEIRNCEHVSLLFVEPRFQRRGVARGLLQHALASCLRNRPDVRAITVNSSPYAVGAYERMGFRRIGPNKVRNGIEFAPMVLDLARTL